MTLTPLDIHNKEFNLRMRGYDQDQVNNFLDQIVKDYEAILKENDELQKKVKTNEEKLAYFTDLKDALNQSIIVAQEAADKVKTNAQKEADIIQQSAEKNAQELLNDATEKSNRILEEASQKARQITVQTDDLRKQARIFRQRLQVMLESQLEVVKSPEWNELLKQNDTSMNQFQNDNIIYDSVEDSENEVENDSLENLDSEDNVVSSEVSDNSFPSSEEFPASGENNSDSVTTIVFPDDE